MHTTKPRRGALTIARGLRTFTLILALLANFLPFAPLNAVQPALAAGGAYTLNFAAADPSIYIPPIPFPSDLTAPIGRADGDPLIPLAEFNNGTSDVRVESLAPQDMALGQIVPFELKISTLGNITPENGVITFVIGWNTLTTNGDDFGYDARNDDVGYGVIGAFIDIGDGAHIDPGNDATVDSFTWSLINDEIVGIFTVSGLDSGDVVVLEPWLVLDDTIGPGVGGNVQSRLIDAATGSDQTINVANSGAITLVNGDSISTGNQTVPLLKPSDFFNANVDVSVTKIDDPDPVVQGETLTYTITASNAGPSVANTVVVYDVLDPNVTFVSASDGGFINTDPGDTIPDGAVQWNVGALAPGDTVEFTVTVTVNEDAPTDSPTGEDLSNSVTVTTISDDTNLANNADTEPTDVLSAFVPAPSLSLLKQISTSASGPWSSSINVTAGDSVYYQFTINNTGNVALSPVSVNDPDVSTASCTFTDPLPVSGSTTCVVGPITALEGTHTNTATASGGYDGQNYNSEPSSATYIAAPQVVVPQPRIVKGTIEGNDTVATLDEPGGSVTINVVVYNDAPAGTGDATLTSLVDDIYGDITTTGHDGITATTCVTGGLIPGGGGYSCSFTVDITAEPANSPIVDKVTATLANAAATVSDDDQANVVINDVAPTVTLVKSASPTTLPEPGGEFVFTLDITNTSSEEVTITALSDTQSGATDFSACSALIGTTLAPGASTSCQYTVNHTEPGSYDNTASVTVTDNDGSTASDTDSETVTVNNVPSAIEVIKTADPTSVDEPGADVTFSFRVNNLSAVDAVTINSLSDTVYGDLNGQGDCSVPQTIPAGGSYSCSVTAFVDATETNVVTASGVDDDGNPVSDDDDATVTVNDVPSSIEVIKTANPTSVDEPGGDVTFTFTVNNTSAVDSVTIDSLTDSIYGDLEGQGDCSVPQTIPAGGSYSCSITEFVAGNAGGAGVSSVSQAGFDLAMPTTAAWLNVTALLNGVVVGTETIANGSAGWHPHVFDYGSPFDTLTFDYGGSTSGFTPCVDNLSYGTNLIDFTGGNGSAPGPQVLDTYDGLNITGLNFFLNNNYVCNYPVRTSFSIEWTGDSPVITNVLTVSGNDDDGNPVGGSDDATVTINDVPSSILTTKTASPASVPETGGDVTFTIAVENTSAVDTVTINSVIDSVYGDVSASCTPALPVDLLPGESVTCSFTEFVSGDYPGSHVNVATASGLDDDGNPVSDDGEETVPFEDVLPDISVTKSASPTSVPETGGNVTFTFVATNNSLEAATLDSLVDSVFGNLDTQGDCTVPQPLAANGGSYSCSITVFLSADDLAPHINVVTATASDDDGNTDTDTDDETVTFTDVAPQIQLTKSASPSSVPETGGDVTFTFLVENTGQEDVSLTSLSDSVFGDLNGQGSCLLPQDILIGNSYSCAITVNLSADDLANHYNLATATAVDDDGTQAQDSDDETVSFIDVLPDVSITKTASPTSVPETGGDVEFTIVVTNNSLEDATIDSLVDSDFNLALQCADAAGTVLGFGESYTCVFTEFISGDYSGPAHENTATVTASDNDGNSDTESDDETVSFIDVLPDVTITKTANPTSVTEPGADVEFTIVVTNNSLEDATIDTLADSDFDLAANCADAVGTVLASGASYTCVFAEFIAGNVGEDHQNTATVVASDNDGNSDTESDLADVTIENATPAVSIVKDGPVSINEGGDSATYDITITNDSVSTDPLTITSLSDDQFGDLLPEAEAANGGPITLNPGDSFTFQITRSLTLDVGETHTNVVTVVGTDDEGTTATDNDDHTVGATDVAPAVSIVKDGPASIDEGGDSATYDITITNDSVSTDPLTITSLTDDQFGDLLPEAEAARGGTIVLNPGESLTFQITRSLEFNVGDLHTNVVTVVGVDDEGTEATDNDDHTVAFDDVAPVIAVEKLPNQDQVFAPGEDVLFTIRVTNNSVSTDPVTITSLVDDVFGDVSAECVLPQTIGPGGIFECDIVRTITADHTNTVTATGVDDEGTEVSESASASVDVINPSVAIEKSTNDFDADAAPGPEILVGASVTWEYLVTNDGDVDLTNISVTDSVLGSVCTIDFLAAGDSTTCTMTGTAAEGQYANTGTASVSYTDADGDTATRSDSDDSHYFGAAPSISIDKQTADDYGNEGDSIGILPGETVTWNYYVTNDGNVTLENVSVSDDQGVTVTCPQDTLVVGESMTCTASGEAVEGWYYNIGTASGDYSDDVGNSTTVTDSDGSSYFGLTPGVVTNSSLCDFGDQFRLIFTPDMGRYSSSTPYYKLSDSNPGQFFYNVFYVNDGSTDMITMEIPYPFVTQGGNPVHVYGGLTVDPTGDGNDINCFNPTNELASYATIFGLGDYTDTNGDGVIGYGDVVLVEVPAELGFQYINIHLDYGLEKTDGWLKKGANATSDGTGKNPAPAGVSINDNTAHTFSAYADDVLIDGSTDTVYNFNEFKQIRGFGGLVQVAGSLDPVVGAQVQLIRDGNVIETMTTDSDGWYLSDYIHKGKAADYTLKLVSTGHEIVVNVGGKVKFGEGNFLIP